MSLHASLALATLAGGIPVHRPFGDAPAAQPAVAVAPDGKALVAAVREKRVWCVSSASPLVAGSEEIAWTSPVCVAPDLAVHGAMRRGPRIAAAGGAIVVTVPTDGRGKEGGDLVSIRSEDGGKTWSAPMRVNETPRSAAEGFHDLVATRSGALFVAWLDARSGPRGQEVWCARSEDGAKSWGKNARAYASPEGTVCECCPIAVAAGEGETVGIVFRNAIAGARDPYLLLSGDGGKKFAAPAKVGNGTWRVAVCPMVEGALAFGPEGPVCLAGREGKFEIVQPGSWARPLGEGAHPALAFGPEGALLALRREGEADLFLALAGEKGAFEPIPLLPPAPEASRDFPLLAAGAGSLAALVFEEREGNAPARTGLAVIGGRKIR